MEPQVMTPARVETVPVRLDVEAIRRQAAMDLARFNPATPAPAIGSQLFEIFTGK